MAKGGKKSTVWVVTELYYPEMTSTGYYLTSTSEGLAEGRDVAVICGQPNYSARGKKAAKFEIRNGVRIHRAAGTRLDKNVIIFRLINMMTFGIAVFAKAMLHFRKGDRILVVTTPPLLPFISAAASLFRGCAYTLLIHDNYPEILVAAGKSTPNSFVVRTLNRCNRWLYKYAARIVVVGRDMEQLVAQKTFGLDIPITTIPNWAELEAVEPAPRSENQLLRELGLLDKFVFLYAGNMGHPNDLESIVECAQRLAAQGSDEIHFIFLGAGVKRKWLEDRVRTAELANITILDPRPRSEQKLFLNACDVALVSLVSRMWGVSMPSRTYNILAAGKPMLAITEPGSELALVAAEDDVGWIVPPGDADALLAKVSEIAENRTVLSEMGNRARATALTRYSESAALEKYKEIF